MEFLQLLLSSNTIKQQKQLGLYTKFFNRCFNGLTILSCVSKKNADAFAPPLPIPAVYDNCSCIRHFYPCLLVMKDIPSMQVGSAL